MEEEESMEIAKELKAIERVVDRLKQLEKETGVKHVFILETEEYLPMREKN